jgi:peptidoglycan/LPS O-acetylase OafA/YrhL
VTAGRPLTKQAAELSRQGSHSKIERVSSSKIASLTGIRGVAACWVVVYHSHRVAEKSLDLPDLKAIPIVSSGYLAVDLFFILSGFILAANYSEKFIEVSSGSFRRFMISRIFRIFPLNTFALICFAFLVFSFGKIYWTGEHLSIRSFIFALLLIQSWGLSSATAWNTPSWSLSTEWLAYFIFPLIIRLISNLKSFNITLYSFIVSLLSLTCTMIVFGKNTLDHVWLLGLPRCLFEFTSGILLWRSLTFINVSSRVSSLFMGSGLVALVIALLDPGLQLIAPLAFSLIIIACAVSNPLANWLFANRAVVFLGEISFSVYLMHGIVLGMFAYLAQALDTGHMQFATKLGFFAVMLCTVLLTSTLTWRFIELPWQKLGRQVNLRLDPKSARPSEKALS